jgi:hypothetical protein
MTHKRADNHPGRQRDKERFEPSEIAKDEPQKAKGVDDKGQNIAQNTRNQGYQQDR